MLNWLKKKFVEGLGDTVKDFFKAGINWLWAGIIIICGMVLTFARKHLGNKLTLTFTVWQVILIVLCVAVSVIVLHIIVRLVRRRRTSSNYWSDVIYGIIWEWDENPAFGFGVDDLTPLCPKCQFELEISGTYVREFDDRNSPIRATFFKCPRCDFKHVENGVMDSVFSFVVGEIERRTRTGEYTDAKTRLKEIQEQKAKPHSE